MSTGGLAKGACGTSMTKSPWTPRLFTPWKRKTREVPKLNDQESTPAAEGRKPSGVLQRPIATRLTGRLAPCRSHSRTEAARRKPSGEFRTDRSEIVQPAEEMSAAIKLPPFWDLADTWELPLNLSHPRELETSTNVDTIKLRIE